MDEIKRALSHVFTRDLRTIEPNKKGLIVGENLRVYDEADGALLRFLKGTEKGQRKAITDRLDTAGVDYKVGDDFVL